MKVSHDGVSLTVRWNDGHESTYGALWLFDNRPAHRDPRNGQRLVDIADLPEAPRIAECSILDGAIEVTFAELAHPDRFDADWLSRNCCCPSHAGAPSAGHSVWTALDTDIPRSFDYAAVLESPAARRDWLAAIAESGIAFLLNVPCEEGRVLEAAALAGYVRESNYGRVFHVRAVPDPHNLAYSALALGLHTDNPYRDPVPGMQMLHCLVASGEGGESIFADGFAVAEALQAEDARAFELLARTPVEFAFADSTTRLFARRPMIKLDPDGGLAAIHYNNRSIQPLRLPLYLQAEFYNAYRHFARLLRDSRFRIQLKLKPGDLVTFNNRRVVHGRTAFPAASQRHLQGCYLEK